IASSSVSAVATLRLRPLPTVTLTLPPLVLTTHPLFGVLNGGSWRLTAAGRETRSAGPSPVSSSAPASSSRDRQTDSPCACRPASPSASEAAGRRRRNRAT